MLRPKNVWGKLTLADWRASKENVRAKLEGNRPIFAIYININKYRLEKKKNQIMFCRPRTAHISWFWVWFLT